MNFRDALLTIKQKKKVEQELIDSKLQLLRAEVSFLEAASNQKAFDMDAQEKEDMKETLIRLLLRF